MSTPDHFVRSTVPPEFHRLISDATKNIPSKLREKTINLLVRYASEDSWLFINLKHVLLNGITINVAMDTTISAFYFRMSTRNIVIHQQFLESAFSIRNFAYYFKYNVFRHELMHAVDGIKMHIEKRTNSLFHELLEWNNITTRLFAALSCVKNTRTLNTRVLDKIAPFLLYPNPYSGQLLWGEETSIHHETPSIGIKYMGSMAEPGLMGYPRFLLGYERISGTRLELYNKSHDAALGWELFQASATIRKQQLPNQVRNNLEQIFLELVPSRARELFRELLAPQRNTLSSLITIAERIVDNLHNEPRCLPPFKACLTTETQDCYIKYWECIQPNNAGGDRTIWQALEEEHAVWMERSPDPRQLPELLETLCEKPAPTVSMEISISRLMLNTAASSLGFSLVEESVRTHVTHNKLSFSNLRILLANLSYVFSLGCLSYYLTDAKSASFSLQVMVPMLFNLLSKAINTIHPVIKYSLVAITFSTQVLSHGMVSTAASFASGMAGSYIGTRLGQSLVSWFVDKPQAQNEEYVHHQPRSQRRRIAGS